MFKLFTAIEIAIEIACGFEVNNLRLNHAIQLLNEHPNYTMKAIAEDSGFNSMPTFNNLFKKKTGMTPFEFKSAQKE